MYKILIVEDDDTITAVLTRTLLKWNYEVQAVVDFGRVGEQFAQFSPDLVLLDISLPFFDGYYSVSYTHLDVYKRQTVSPMLLMMRPAG